jgi:hypothetical protein
MNIDDLGAYLRVISKTCTSSRFVPMSNIQNSTSPQVLLIFEWGRGFQEKNVDSIAKSLHADFRHITHPRSLNRPDQNKDEWLIHLSKIFPFWTENEVNRLGC